MRIYRYYILLLVSPRLNLGYETQVLRLPQRNKQETEKQQKGKESWKENKKKNPENICHFITGIYIVYVLLILINVMKQPCLLHVLLERSEWTFSLGYEAQFPHSFRGRTKKDGDT